jgi:hypothetical protein
MRSPVATFLDAIEPISNGTLTMPYTHRLDFQGDFDGFREKRDKKATVLLPAN